MTPELRTALLHVLANSTDTSYEDDVDAIAPIIDAAIDQATDQGFELGIRHAARRRFSGDE
jgi:hypothetical protein